MEFEKIKNKGQGQLFKSDYMERMTKTHPIVIYSMYIPAIIFFFYYAISYLDMSLGRILLLFVFGVLSWTLFEYIMHRFLFHMVTNTPRADRLVYTLHGVHHEYPRDKERLFMPPVPSLIVASLLFFLSYQLMGWNAVGFFAGFLTGYLLYGTMHYAIHAFAPPRFLKALWRNHHLHHYKEPEKGFGVSSVLWDHLLGTIPKRGKKA